MNILLEAIQDLLIKEVLPAIKDNESLSYKTLVSWNMLGVINREIKFGEKNLNEEIIRVAEFLKLKVDTNQKTYLEKQEISIDLQTKLNEYILENKSSLEDEKVWNLVKESLKEKLEISNPRYNSGE